MIVLLNSINIYYGALSPGWNTFRAYSSGHRGSLALWLKYWVIYALLQGLECLTDFHFDGMHQYKLLKLILSGLLWFSSPHSTYYIYTVIAKLVSVLGSPWYMYIYRSFWSLMDSRWYLNKYRSFWSADQKDNHAEQRGDPPIVGHTVTTKLVSMLGCPWYMYIYRSFWSVMCNRWFMFTPRSFWSADQKDNHVKQEGEPPLDGELLKRELDELLT